MQRRIERECHRVWGKITGELPVRYHLKHSSTPNANQLKKIKTTKIQHVETHSAHQADAVFFTEFLSDRGEYHDQEVTYDINGHDEPFFD